MHPRVSVVVPTFNRRLSLMRLLDALATQTYPADLLEVLVVDDGSTDDTVDYLQCTPSPFARRVLTQTHAGPAAARDLGAEQALGSLIVFLDDDVAPIPSLIARHVADHDSMSRAVVVGPMSPPVAW